MTKIEREIRKYNILGIATAWGGGKRKFMWDVCGKPSMQWALEAALGCKYLDKIVFISEDKEMIAVAEKLGIFTIARPLYTSYPYPRDKVFGDFRTDKPRSLKSRVPDVYLDPMLYAEYWLKETEGYYADLIFRISPEAPLVKTETANKVVEVFFEDREATEAATFTEGPRTLFIHNKNQGGRPYPLLHQYAMDRQERPSVYFMGPYHLSGQPSRWESQGLTMVPVFISQEEALCLHNEDDLFRARCYMKRRLIKAGKEVEWEMGRDDVRKKEKGEKE